MSFLGFLAREMMRSRAHGSRGRYRRSTWGIGPRRPRSRAYYGWGHQPRGYYPVRHRRGGR